MQSPMVRNHSMNCNWAMNFLFLYADAASFFGSCSKSMRIAQRETSNLNPARSFIVFCTALLLASEHTMFCDFAQRWHKSAPCNWSSRCRIWENSIHVRTHVHTCSNAFGTHVVACAHVLHRITNEGWDGITSGLRYGKNAFSMSVVKKYKKYKCSKQNAHYTTQIHNRMYSVAAFNI